METVKKKDFVDLVYTGYANGEMFDSNFEEDLKKIDSKSKPHKTVIVVGEQMVVPGLDKALEGKEVGKEYKVSMKAEEGFGKRKAELVKTIPLKVFREQGADPKPGMVFSMDNSMARIIAVSGARVITDFNNPLSGKDIDYKFIVKRIINDEKEKIEEAIEMIFRAKLDHEISDKVKIKGQKEIEYFVNAFKDRFKELTGKEIVFELKEEKKEDNKEA